MKVTAFFRSIDYFYSIKNKAFFEDNGRLFVVFIRFTSF